MVGRVYEKIGSDLISDHGQLLGGAPEFDHNIPRHGLVQYHDQHGDGRSLFWREEGLELIDPFLDGAAPGQLTGKSPVIDI